MRKISRRNTKNHLLLMCVFMIGPVVLTGCWVQRELHQEHLDKKLILAIKNVDERQVNVLLEQGANPNSRESNSDRLSVWQILLRKLTREPEATKSGNTALILSLQTVSHDSDDEEPHLNRKMIEDLLHHGAQVNTQDEEGWTPLMYAAMMEDPAAVQLLLRYHARAELFNNKGQTARVLATLWVKHWMEPSDVEKVRRMLSKPEGI